MSRLRQLRLDNHRNLATTTLELHPRCTLISGKNGSGKTALLEAIYLLGRGKSFRENQTRHLIAHEQPYFRLIARIEKNGAEHLLGIEKSAREHRLRLDGQNLKNLAALAALTPVQILNSDNFAHIDQGPERRRRYLDYGLYYHDPAFLPAWQRYNYALKNRNAALRQNWRAADLAPWNHILGETGTQIDTLRRAYLEKLEDTLNTYHAELGGYDRIHIHYQRGWPAGQPLAALLDACHQYVRHNGQHGGVTWEYVMLRGVNDTPEHARQLVELLRGIPGKINLIPFNAFPGSRYQCSRRSDILAFQRYLTENGYVATIRKTRGEDIDAACGQLVGQFKDRLIRERKQTRKEVETV